MTHPSPTRATLALSALVAVGSSWLVAAPAGAAAPTTCAGKPVTIVATTTVTQGTEGDDVVAMEPGQWNTFDARGGDDTVCLAVGKADINDRDSRPPYGFLDAGTGDDTVVNLTPAGTTGTWTTVFLGLGSDSFQGADVGEEVYADLRTFQSDDPYGVDPAFTGPQTDVVTGAATVHTAAPNDGANADRITLGGSDARLVASGPLAPEGRIEAPAAGSAVLEIRRPSGLRPGTAEVRVDAASRTVTADGVPVLSWTGVFDAVSLGAPGLRVDEPTVSFAGTDRPETLSTTDVPVGEVELGGGSDTLFVNSLNRPFIPRAADGGAGRDQLVAFAGCRSLTVRVGGGSACDAVEGAVSDFAGVAVATEVPGSSTTLVGSDRGERLSARGHHVVVRGHGGADTILAEGRVSARVAGGAGSDDVVARSEDLLVRGQAGRDILEVARSLEPARTDRRRRVAFGGPGRDLLLGGGDARPERLVGGPGRDSADGRKGRRDRCSAEVVRRCELR